MPIKIASGPLTDYTLTYRVTVCGEHLVKHDGLLIDITDVTVSWNITVNVTSTDSVSASAKANSHIYSRAVYELFISFDDDSLTVTIDNNDPDIEVIDPVLFAEAFLVRYRMEFPDENRGICVADLLSVEQA